MHTNPYLTARKVVIALTASAAFALPFALAALDSTELLDPFFEAVRGRVPRSNFSELPTPTPSSTAAATGLPRPHKTATLVPTFTPMPGSDFSGAYVAETIQLSPSVSLVRLVVPKGLTGVYEAIVTLAREYIYTCLVPDGHPSVLLCYGTRLPNGAYPRIAVYHEEPAREFQRLVYQSRFLVSYVVPTSTKQATSPTSPTPSALASATKSPTPTSSLSPTSTGEILPSITPVPSITPTAAPDKCKPPDHPVFGCTPTPVPTFPAASPTPAGAPVLPTP